MLSGLVTALRTLTVLPVPGKDTANFSSSLFWFPVVGLLLALFQVALGYAGVGRRTGKNGVCSLLFAF